jgi:hypothetical protein
VLRNARKPTAQCAANLLVSYAIALADFVVIPCKDRSSTPNRRRGRVARSDRDLKNAFGKCDNPLKLGRGGKPWFSA